MNCFSMHCDHSLTPLYQTKSGVVFRCPSCSCFHVVFGPVVLAYDSLGLSELKLLVDTLEPTPDPSTHIGDRCYHLHTTSRQVGLAFTQEEIDELRVLVGGATAVLHLEDELREELGPDALNHP